MAKERRRLSRGGLHRVERAKRQQKTLITAAIVVVSAVLVLVVGGSIYEAFIRPPQPVATVGDEVITTREFEARVKFERSQWVARYNQTYQAIQFYQNNPDILNQIYAQLQQITNILEPNSMGERILQQMIDERLLRQEANRRGIYVTDEEIDAAIMELFEYYPGGTPTIEATQTLQLTSTLSATQFALITVTPTATITPTTSITPTETLPPEMLATSGIFTSTPTTTPTPETPTPDPDEATEAPAITPTLQTTEQAGLELDEYLQGLEIATKKSFDAEDLRSIYEFDLYRQKMYDVAIEEFDEEPLQVWVRHILVEDEETALEVLEELAAGESWVDMVLEYSTNPSSALNDGDLGWFLDRPQEPDFPQEFMDAAFSLAIGDLSEPIETPTGWHVIQILGKENRQLSAAQINQFTQEVFLEFVEDLRAETEIVYADYWMNRIPREPAVPANPFGNIPTGP